MPLKLMLVQPKICMDLLTKNQAKPKERKFLWYCYYVKSLVNGLVSIYVNFRF